MKRFFLLSDWATAGSGFGPAIFTIGKGIGILGRVGVPILILVAIVACFVEPKLLFFVGYGGGPFLLAWLCVDLVARALMLLGNWWATSFGSKT
ncbi:hypothetical protein BWI17_00560 [Betaproteobacteria bacterium GR16-43]|nr:hypothetical protein BWI17_00560 [Betaproteobacteria bacterium GR16-43]